MVKNLYILKDNLTNEFTTMPFVSANEQTAKREVKVAFSHPNMRLQANDSILYSYGTFESESGVITCELKSICNVGGLFNE